MKKLVFLLLFCSSMLVCAAPLVIGVLSFAPPFSSVSGKGDHFFGFSVDLMNALCQRLQLQCTYKAAPFFDQFVLLDEGKIDVALSPDPITSKDAGSYLFSLPYFPSEGRFVTLATSNYSNVSDFKNKRLGILSYTLDLAAVQEANTEFSEIKPYGKYTTLISALVNNDVDAIILNEHFAQYMINNGFNKLKLVGPAFSIGRGYGILALKNKTDLIHNLNAALLSIQSDGTYLALYSKYFGT